MRRTVAVGPFPVFFGNVNTAMNLRGHYHTGSVTLIYESTGPHGYPSFKATNDAIRERLQQLTEKIFRDATNEDVTDRLFAAFDGWSAPQWQQWGGDYILHAVHLAVQGVLDSIGHDDSTTIYTTARD
ncbi:MULTISPECIES: hypothetical protein [Frankia]|uniref:Uncharacterized protein n=1 Tax=Frankia alni (strain DSM 45986 / CECT 9034 / ACN14a) TaxID=326424 RepID=Q0RM64_FRAAA|nr:MULTISPECIES: hypothetical protein [Frankia]CAJ61388.1 hypothetical protein FRAAL2744 [Frankia alni ACN14a]